MTPNIFLPNGELVTILTKFKKKWNSLQFMLLLTYILVGVVPLVLFTNTIFRTMNEYFVEERKKELLRTLRRGPDLDRFIDEQKRTFVSYAQGARMYSMNYYSFVKLAKEAGANIRIKKNVVIDLELIEKFLENNCEGAEGEM